MSLANGTFTLLLAATLAAAPCASACQCGKTDVLTAVSHSGAVFRGKVTSVRDSYGFIRKLRDRILGPDEQSDDFSEYYLRYGFRVVVEVTDVWKGSVPKTAIVITGRGGGDCGFHFTAGTAYLFYADTDGRGNFATNICTRTAEASTAATDILVLGTPHPPR